MNSRRGIGLLTVFVALAGAHCGEDASSAEEGSERSDGGEAEPDAAQGDTDSGETHTQSDGGTIDLKRDGGTITVCGGSKGDPSAVPLLGWFIANNPAKYAVLLGATAPEDEPMFYSSTLVVADGRMVESSARTAHVIGADGPFGSKGGITKASFAKFAMPETDPVFDWLGWSEYTELFYTARTELAVSNFKDIRVAGWAAHYGAQLWTLENPKRASDQPATFYVQQIQATLGVGWLFTVAFDHPCKASAFDALVGQNPLDMLNPPPPKTRAQVSGFLVDNNARLMLSVMTVGAEDSGIKAALNGTQASAGTLDALESTMTAFRAALKVRLDNAGTPDYASVTAGINPRWVIGGIRTQPVSGLPVP